MLSIKDFRSRSRQHRIKTAVGSAIWFKECGDWFRLLPVGCLPTTLSTALTLSGHQPNGEGSRLI